MSLTGKYVVSDETLKYVTGCLVSEGHKPTCLSFGTDRTDKIGEMLLDPKNSVAFNRGLFPIHEL